MAKKFAYLCIGLLAIMLASNLLVMKAQSQSANRLVDVAWRRADGYAYAVTSTGEIWANPGYCGGWTKVGQLPAGCTPVSVLDGDVGGSLDIGCESGDFYTVVGSPPSVQVVLCSSMFGAQVQARSQSWGAVKAGYR